MYHTVRRGAYVTSHVATRATETQNTRPNVAPTHLPPTPRLAEIKKFGRLLCLMTPVFGQDMRSLFPSSF